MKELSIFGTLILGFAMLLSPPHAETNGHHDGDGFVRAPETLNNSSSAPELITLINQQSSQQASSQQSSSASELDAKQREIDSLKSELADLQLRYDQQVATARQLQRERDEANMLLSVANAPPAPAPKQNQQQSQPQQRASQPVNYFPVVYRTNGNGGCAGNSCGGRGILGRRR